MTLRDAAQAPNDAPGTHGARSDSNLMSALEDHRRWLNTRGRKGSPLTLIDANLEGANLRLAILSEANLQGADLENALLEGGRLQETNLQNASLRGANLQRVFMPQSNLQGADLYAADLQEASIYEANLQGANLLSTNLQQADLHASNLQRALLKEAHLAHSDLQSANLQGASLQQADCVHANLRHAVMVDANLSLANFNGADLQSANLHGCNLQDTSLQQANLQHVDFTGSSGLLCRQLAGSDVSGARFSDHITLLDGLPNIRELTRQARMLYLLVLSGSLLAWLCFIASTDAQLIANAPMAIFPDFRLPIPTLTAYYLLPFILVATFVFLNLYLQRLWEEVAALPAVFPDGRSLDRVIHPWLPNGLIRAYSPRLRHNYPALSHLQIGLSKFFIWWGVPLTLLAFWLSGLPRRDWLMTFFHLNLTVFTFGLALLFQNLARTTLQGKRLRRYKHASLAVIQAGMILTVLSSISFGALTGVPPHIVASERITSPGLATSLQRLVPQLLHFAGHAPFAELTEAELSTRLANPGALDKTTGQVRGADLQQMNLRYANAAGAFLVKADLRFADLLGANLRLADLRGARLHGANLSGADLKGTNLRHATGLTQAQIQSAIIDQHTVLPVIQQRFSPLQR